MKRHTTLSVAILLASIGLVACQGGSDSTGAAQQEPAAASGKPALPVAGNDSASPGKPTAPISMSYEIVGNPIVGQPVLINVEVRSAAGPVNVRYSITDASALMFQVGQVERLEIADPSAGSVQQLSVIPQREGRLYVNVAAEVQTPNGAMIRSMAIPIKTGSAPEKPTINGELKEGPDGEIVISMPAEESN